MEGLKDLLVGPGVELLSTREPGLPTEAESGGNMSPGITASECQGRGPRCWEDTKENGVVPGAECCQGPGKVHSAHPLLLHRW